ncbi:MAG: HAD-IC family P-type ATPase [Deltaproteobacteria bacterium]|jgi:cation transport ATPase|nr:HAD-IC family P-type ATPase [Deltaproteobacteria bacterium]
MKNKQKQQNNDKHAKHAKMFKKKFWISLLLSIPVLVLSKSLQNWVGLDLPDFRAQKWIVFLFSTIVFGVGGIPFLKMSGKELKNKKPGMMTLISLAISVSYLYSAAGIFAKLGNIFFWELVTLIDVMLLGHWLEMKSINKATGSLDELAKLVPDQALKIKENGDKEEVSTEQLQKGDLILIKPGASIPLDGKVESGESYVNEAMLTGESKPQNKQPGDKVIGGTINQDGSLQVRITSNHEESTLSGIMKLVAQAQNSKTPTRLLADKAAGLLFYLALFTAITSTIVWTLLQGFHLGVLKRTVTILVIACPHALGLAIPLVISIITSISAKHVREGSRKTVKKLNEQGIKVAMITGDNEGAAKKTAQELGIENYYSEILPDEKSKIIEDLKEKLGKTAMVGDGINDAPALATADLGIAIGSGTDVAIESASIILLKNRPTDILKLLKISKINRKKMIQNLFWAAGYNLLALPIAAGALTVYGVTISPATGAVFMSLSTIIVAFNAQLLKLVSFSD